jgi:hypothetical protein
MEVICFSEIYHNILYEPKWMFPHIETESFQYDE